MKRFFALILALALAVSLAACGGSPGGEVKTPADVSGVRDDAPETPAAPDKTVDPVEPSADAAKEASIEETVLVDEQGVKITAKGLDAGSLFGPELKLLIENESGKDLIVQARNASVNGYMVDAMLSADVVSGKKANDELTFMESDLKACGIETIADMEFSFHIFDSDWETYLDTPKLQLKTSAAEGYAYTFDDSGDLAYEGSGVKVVVKGLSEDDSIFGPGVVVYIENNGDEDVTVQTRDVSVNGFMVSAVFSSEVCAGKRAVDSITFLSSDLEDNGITEIKDIELSFHIFESGGWDTIVDTDTIAITF